MSKSMVETFCADVFSTPLCAGQVCAVEAERAAATDAVMSELRKEVRGQATNVDETSWRQNQQQAWLWIVVTQMVTVFPIALSRAAAVAQWLIDPLAKQVITTDRYRGYLWLPLRQC